MSEDREQEPTDKRESAARPVTAAARRERRASARQVAPDSGSGQTESAKADSAKVVSTKGGKTTESKEDRGEKTASRDRQVKRPNVFKRLVRFLREVVAELRKVIWPTRKMLVTYTIVVLVFVAVMVALVFGLDYAFLQGVSFVFGK
ncbi:preprotein translocase subunit SecE [Kutzneria sp. NPDC052558]|uniref:preprotein translocase subunit SecE n=1 Tax=Kutzneria sp. NPDC052558 TaxID=3364121 RepID=UPI0037CC8176